jgi:hypothetical protein
VCVCSVSPLGHFCDVAGHRSQVSRDTHVPRRPAIAIEARSRRLTPVQATAYSMLASTEELRGQDDPARLQPRGNATSPDGTVPGRTALELPRWTRSCSFRCWTGPAPGSATRRRAAQRHPGPGGAPARRADRPHRGRRAGRHEQHLQPDRPGLLRRGAGRAVWPGTVRRCRGDGVTVPAIDGRDLAEPLNPRRTAGRVPHQHRGPGCSRSATDTSGGPSPHDTLGDPWAALALRSGW